MQSNISAVVNVDKMFNNNDFGVDCKVLLINVRVIKTVKTCPDGGFLPHKLFLYVDNKTQYKNKSLVTTRTASKMYVLTIN